MPITVPEGLPAAEALKKENILPWTAKERFIRTSGNFFKKAKIAPTELTRPACFKS